MDKILEERDELKRKVNALESIIKRKFSAKAFPLEKQNNIILIYSEPNLDVKEMIYIQDLMTENKTIENNFVIFADHKKINASILNEAELKAIMFDLTFSEEEWVDGLYKNLEKWRKNGKELINRNSSNGK